MELTDELVVKTLAEFEGYTLRNERENTWWNPDKSSWSYGIPRDYLSDPDGYGPIAEVWRKVFDADRQDFYELIDDFSDNHHWWGVLPSFHAYAIARAILEAKQKPAEPPEEQ